MRLASKQPHVVPEDAILVPDGVLVVPEGVMLVPDGVHAVPEDVILVRNGVRAVPDGERVLPDGVLVLPDPVRVVRRHPRPLVRCAWLLLCVALAACGAATGVDVPQAPDAASARDALAVDTGDASSATCEECFLPNVCVSESTTSTHSVSTPFACVATPAACDGVVSCACASQLCGGQVCFDGTTQLHRSFLTCYAP